eukprot:TRINITY_DN14930_c0_g1_i1.p1 TRINITY_DN14930_c0_g1~~TRINITY_DN14930_c0_g1_i1.p1  ORF type:complete len:509 (+),score=142.53 TRINITY_DN14930_c0_g1_i1:155-1681(+)
MDPQTTDVPGPELYGEKIYDEPEAHFVVYLVVTVMTVMWEAVFDKLYQIRATRPVTDLKPYVARELVSFGLTGLCLSLMSETALLGSLVPREVYRYLQFVLFVKATLMVIIIITLVARLRGRWGKYSMHEQFRETVLGADPALPATQAEETLGLYWQMHQSAQLLARSVMIVKAYLRERGYSGGFNTVQYLESLTYRWLLDIPRFRWTHWLVAVVVAGLATLLCALAGDDLRAGGAETLYLAAALNWLMLAVTVYISYYVHSAYQKQCDVGVPVQGVRAGADRSGIIGDSSTAHGNSLNRQNGGSAASYSRLEFQLKLPEEEVSRRQASVVSKVSRYTGNQSRSFKVRPDKVPLGGPLTTWFFVKRQDPSSLGPFIQVLLLLQMLYLSILLTAVAPAMLGGLYGFALILASILPSVILYVHTLPNLIVAFTTLSAVAFEFIDEELLDELCRGDDGGGTEITSEEDTTETSDADAAQGPPPGSGMQQPLLQDAGWDELGPLDLSSLDDL